MDRRRAERPPAAGGQPSFEPESFQSIPASKWLALIRISGRLSSPVARRLPAIELVVKHGGGEERLAPLPDPHAEVTLATPEGESWRGAFSVPLDVADDREARFFLDLGGEAEVEVSRDGSGAEEPPDPGPPATRGDTESQAEQAVAARTEAERRAEEAASGRREAERRAEEAASARREAEAAREATELRAGRMLEQLETARAETEDHRRALDKAHERIEGLTRALEEARSGSRDTESAGELRAREALEDAERARRDAEQAQGEAERAQQEAEQAQADTERAQAEAERARAESGELAATVARLEDELEAARAEASSSATAIHELEHRLEETGRALAQAEAAAGGGRADLEDELERQRHAENALRQELRARDAELSLLRSSLEEQSARAGEVQRQAGEVDRRFNELEQRAREAEERAEVGEQRVMAAEERAEAAERRAEAAESRAEAAELEAADSRTELETTAGELSRLRTRDGGSNGAAPEAPAEPPDADGSRDEPTDEADLPAAGPQPRAEPAAAQTADPASGGGPDDDFFTKLSEAKKAVESEG